MEFLESMRFSQMLPSRRAFFSFCSLAVLLCLSFSTVDAATVGSVVPVLGVVADLLHDSARNVVYLANITRNEIDIYSIGDKKVIASLPTGLSPGSLAISPDLHTLYVANIG